MDKRVVIIVGASKGIGRATASLFHNQGDQVVVAARSREPLEDFQKEHPGSEIVVSDMTDPKAIVALFDTTVEKFGRVDVVVLSAAPFMSKPLTEVTAEEWSQSSKYLDMIFHVNQQAALKMSNNQKGVVVNISSRAGLREDVLPKSSVYAMLKNAMVALVASANQESDNVQFIALCPGLVGDTEMGQRAVAEREGMDNGESLTAREVAEKIVSLVEGASEKSPHIYRLTKEHDLEIIQQPAQDV